MAARDVLLPTDEPSAKPSFQSNNATIAHDVVYRSQRKHTAGSGPFSTVAFLLHICLFAKLRLSTLFIPWESLREETIVVVTVMALLAKALLVQVGL